MPQLSPLSWLILFFMFWFNLFSISVFLWWIKENKYNLFFKKTIIKKYNFNKKWAW
uniref:ATP synthase F0 subunit 8 n=1 Tax=Callochiton steinenii TaxID=2719128 RepID=A0A6H1PGA1_9MOLL|nr:ATP synthase F0 subunit 8 [Callochiton steinenii]